MKHTISLITMDNQNPPEIRFNRDTDKVFGGTHDPESLPNKYWLKCISQNVFTYFDKNIPARSDGTTAIYDKICSNMNNRGFRILHMTEEDKLVEPTKQYVEKRIRGAFNRAKDKLMKADKKLKLPSKYTMKKQKKKKKKKKKDKKTKKQKKNKNKKVMENKKKTAVVTTKKKSTPATKKKSTPTPKLIPVSAKHIKRGFLKNKVPKTLRANVKRNLSKVFNGQLRKAGDKGHGLVVKVMRPRGNHRMISVQRPSYFDYRFGKVIQPLHNRNHVKVAAYATGSGRGVNGDEIG